jgi:hypothetical protein
MYFRHSGSLSGAPEWDRKGIARRDSADDETDRAMVLEQAIFHSNQYYAGAACEHCSGVIRHETWCITRNQLVYYAYGTVLEPDRLTLTDRLILHALGVSWIDQPAQNPGL